MDLVLICNLEIKYAEMKDKRYKNAKLRLKTE